MTDDILSKIVKSSKSNTFRTTKTELQHKLDIRIPGISSLEANAKINRTRDYKRKKMK